MRRTLRIGLGALALTAAVVGMRMAADSSSAPETGTVRVQVLDGEIGTPAPLYRANVIGMARDGKAPPPPTATPTPEPTATPTPVPSADEPPALHGGSYGEDTMRDILRTVGWPEWDVPTALRVSRCESDWTRRATGALGEASLFQIHPVHFWRFDGRSPWDPIENARVALELRLEQGWGIWSCY